jgi:hypothetical protein
MFLVQNQKIAASADGMPQSYKDTDRLEIREKLL